MNKNIMNNISKTDWNRIDEMKDEDIDTSDIPPLSEDFWAKAQLRMPNPSVTVEVEVDPETFAWFQAQGRTAQQQMSVALKIYAQANKVCSSSTTTNP
jgi:uncharacterized protein (DUF4415 family)